MFTLVAKVFEEDELGDHVAVPRRWSRHNFAGLQRFSNTAECFVGQFFGGRTVAPIKVRYQPPAHLEITLAVGIDAVIEPREQSREPEFRNFWFFS